MFKWILKEPLIHFFAVGIAVFVAFSFFSSEEISNSPQTIVVDRQKLVAFLQFQERLAEPAAAEKIFDELSSARIQILIDDYVKNEALFREARALKLDEENYPTRQRMIQQLEYLNEEFITSAISFTPSDLQDYFDANREKYREPPKITFAHVFFDSKTHGTDDAKNLAATKLEELIEKKIPFRQSTQHGERFLFQPIYRNSDQEEIVSHFGSGMQEELFGLTPNKTLWRGPFQSDHGFHLVLVTNLIAGNTPTLEEITVRVEQDALHALIQEEKEQLNQSIVDTYAVEIGTLSKENVVDRSAED